MRSVKEPATTAPSYDIVSDPTTAGIEPAALAALISRCRREIDDGRLPSCQVAVAKDNQLIAYETLGGATGDSRYVIFSATKAFVVGAFWLLLADGTISLDQRVAEFIPEFGSNGKDVITLRQLLLHEGGFPLAPLNPVTEGSNPARRQRFSRWGLNWEPGTRFEYHATSAHWVIADLIETLSGEDFRDFVRGHLLEPIGLKRFQLGVPAGDQGDIKTLELCGEPATLEELVAAGIPPEMASGAVTDEMLLSLNVPEARESGLPGGGGVSTAADVALYYQALLHNPGGLWDASVLRSGTSEVHGTLPDLTSGVSSNGALGLGIAGEDPGTSLRGFGHTVSPRTFGHAGAGGQIAFADPDSGISFCYLTNGLDSNVLTQSRRSTGIASRVGPLAPAAA